MGRVLPYAIAGYELLADPSGASTFSMALATLVLCIVSLELGPFWDQGLMVSTIHLCAWSRGFFWILTWDQGCYDSSSFLRRFPLGFTISNPQQLVSGCCHPTLKSTKGL